VIKSKTDNAFKALLLMISGFNIANVLILNTPYELNINYN